MRKTRAVSQGRVRGTVRKRTVGSVSRVSVSRLVGGDVSGFQVSYLGSVNYATVVRQGSGAVFVQTCEVTCWLILNITLYTYSHKPFNNLLRIYQVFYV